MEFLLLEVQGDGPQSVKLMTGIPGLCVFWVLYEILVSLDLLLSVFLQLIWRSDVRF